MEVGVQQQLLRACTEFEAGVKATSFGKNLQNRLVKIPEFVHLQSHLLQALQLDWKLLVGLPMLDLDLLGRLHSIFEQDCCLSWDWGALQAFIDVVLVWGAEKCVDLNILAFSCGVGLAELASLNLAFQRHDDDLAGGIFAGRLKACLSDMGQEYADEELEAILRLIDPEAGGWIEFSRFVSWWSKIPTATQSTS